MHHGRLALALILGLAVGIACKDRDDGDKSTPCADGCDWCWEDTMHEQMCPESWDDDGENCDCGCQFEDPDCEGVLDEND